MSATEDGKDCFLCTPDLDLIFSRAADSFALCGLGPLVQGYSVVATSSHTASAADAIAAAPQFVDFAESLRNVLSKEYGSCLLTEHGRLPVCTDPSGTSDPHCYHAHFLLFPGAPDVSQTARSHFRLVHSAPSLKSALKVAAKSKDYFLISPKPEEAYVMTRPGRIIRQFARVLVADALGIPTHANWRRFPDRESCAKTAAYLRALCNGGRAA